LKNGLITTYAHWRKITNDIFYCQQCYNLHITSKHRLRFKNNRIYSDNIIRVGVCNLCRAVIPFDCKTTHLHHEQYDAKDKARHTIELCDSCHGKLHGRPKIKKS
jgi:hypothetical protein